MSRPGLVRIDSVVIAAIATGHLDLSALMS